MFKNIKIIIIENQRTQYEALYDGFNASGFGWEIYPTKEEWCSFMDYVKVVINDDYQYVFDGKYRGNAKIKLWEIIQKIEPDLLIVDYFLGGTTCEKGVELAKDIVNGLRQKNPQFSIVFLSRELPSGDDYDRFKEDSKGKIYTDWLLKSFSQNEVLEKNYIKEVLCRDIKALLNKNNLYEELNEYYNKTKNSQFSKIKPIIESIIEKLKKGESLSEEQISIIRSKIEEGNIISENEAKILSIN